MFRTLQFNHLKENPVVAPTEGTRTVVEHINQPSKRKAKAKDLHWDLANVDDA